MADRNGGRGFLECRSLDKRLPTAIFMELPVLHKTHCRPYPHTSRILLSKGWGRSEWLRKGENKQNIQLAIGEPRKV